MSTRRRLVAYKLVPLVFKPRNVSIDVVGSETQMMDASTAFFQKCGDGPFTVKWIYQFDASWGEREKGGRCLRRLNVLSTFGLQTKISHKPLYG